MSIYSEAKTQNNSRSRVNFLLLACLALSLAGCATAPYSGTEATSQLTTEAEIVNQMGWEERDNCRGQVFPSHISPTEEINVRVYRDVDESLATYKTFDFDYTSKTNPLLEKELFRQLEKVLQAHGLTRVKENPQVTISMDFFIGKKEQYTPPTTVTSTEIKSVWNTATIGWNVVGFSTPVPVISSTTKPGYTKTSYYSNIRLNFLNHAKLVAGAKPETPPLIWLGEAEHGGLDPDIRGFAPVMFGELMEHFSDQSANSSNCYVRRFRYGGLGLGFDPSDWRVIRYVEPSSVAAEHGIKPGDVLIKVNGKDPKRSFTFSDFPYNSKDPYFRYVLSNRGDSDVELVIQSAETGKSAMFRMRPRLEDRYPYVDLDGHPIQKTADSPK
jgi:PDZ domain